jgi:hypothetical protein
MQNVPQPVPGCGTTHNISYLFRALALKADVPGSGYIDGFRLPINIATLDFAYSAYRMQCGTSKKPSATLSGIDWDYPYRKLSSKFIPI